MQFIKSFTINPDGTIDCASDETLQVTRTALLAKSGPELNTLYAELTGDTPPVRNEGREPKADRILKAMTRRWLAQNTVNTRPEPTAAELAAQDAAEAAQGVTEAPTPTNEDESMATATKSKSKTKSKTKAAPKPKKAPRDKSELTAKQAAALKQVPKDKEWRSSHQLGILIAHCKQLTEKGFLKAREVAYGSQGKTKTQYVLA